MIRLWATIANKLGISHEEAMLLHALLRGWLNPLARRKAYIVVTKIFDKFELKESFEQSYAQQLLDRGVLTSTEAEVFSGSYHDQADRQTTGTAEESADGNLTGFTKPPARRSDP